MATSMKTATAEMRNKPSRFIAVLLAIAIGVGFAAATAIFSSTAGAAAERAVSLDIQNADVVVWPNTDEDIDEVLAKIDATEGVSGSAPLVASQYSLPEGPVLSPIIVRASIADEQLNYGELAEGSWPKAVDEIALDPDTAQSANVGIGDEVTLVNSLDEIEYSFTVVAITKPDPTTENFSGDVSWATLEFMKQSDGTWTQGYLVRSDDPEATVAALKDTLGGDFSVQTADDARQEAVDEITGGTVAISVVLGVFGAIALAVAAIVIANTFTILLAQRRRTIALQRLIGATTKQMTRQIVIESGIVAIVGTIIGIGLSILVGYLAANSLGFAGAGLSVPPLGLTLAAVAGIGTTMLAAYFPIRRAARIAPIEAMRPAEAEASGASIARWRLITGGILLVLGLIPFVFGIATHSLPLAALGGVLAVMGILLAAQLIVVPLAKLLRPLGRLAGTPGKIAARDVVRHPARATNTVVALIVGVGLMSTLKVASSTVVATVEAEFQGSLEEFKIVREILEIMTNVATSLLAVAAVIAIVGIANTLALAVIERNRESALMRALGLHRGQLRTMVCVEAVLLGLIGSVTGVVLGIGFGLAGAYSAVGAAGFAVDIPWVWLGGFIAAGVVGGLLAGLLPAIRATRVQPVAALASA